MRKLLFITSFFTLIFLQSLATLATEPQNLYVAKQTVIQYHESGDYGRDLAKVATEAQNYLTKKISEKNKSANRKFAIVLDIDDTAVSDYAASVATDFGGGYVLLDQYHKKGNYPATPEILKIYRYAQKNNVSVFFITGRGDELKEATIKNLKAAGYKNWNNIYFRPSNYSVFPRSIIPFKIESRKAIYDQGYTIILNIGDQYSDLVGGYAERIFKLPNPFCYTP